MAVEITQGQLFEMLGRMYAELRAVAQDNERLRAAIQALEAKKGGK